MKVLFKNVIMSWNDWLQKFFTELKTTPLLEWLGVISGVAEVLFAKANKIWLYPCGIISVVLSTYIFYHSGLYAESGLNLYYFIMSLYGWWWWINRKDHPAPPVTRADKKDWLVTITIVIAGFVLLYFVLRYYTDSAVPVADAWVSATAWAGMWLLAKRKIENWLLLNISNIFAIPLLIYKGLPLYALLTLFLFIIAIMGYVEWNRIITKKNRNSDVFTARS
ncbi:MAG: nicotinamide riboside transporter PnuC [Niabella sp.]